MGGLTGPIRDANAGRTDRRRAPLPVGEGPQGVHPVDSRWRHETVRAWEELWNSPVINVAGDIDVPALRRLFTYYDLWTRMTDAWLLEITRFETAFDEATFAGNDALLGENIKGEAKVSPYLASLDKLEQVIGRLEERFGITPLVRAKLGITLNELKKGNAGPNRPPRKQR